MCFLLERYYGKEYLIGVLKILSVLISEMFY